MGKKKKNPKKPMQVWKLYQSSGDKTERKNKFCPKCGEGTFLANHKDRLTCGKCSYTEMISKK
ncbi:MAG: 30S ribosomal protein S27ae [Candidatus Woesearchaeota archaeon]|jgi:small subunit ribosomal protein S27Ae|nr:30S ribosomal protein S27ae [archaeon]MDP6547510.1 30S ribosomal protein S27ae [Candidatus Woesearchaeota archaeon]MDP7263492.1 30S ribosomal protein S27ae [Candidatus Woesearchaeota archaeon]MDP7623213.1 30S ribosomal protein S27ae [Candidatus Woesearchaeota archaeon]HJN56799.1 30S ribosomal protein S27ae [Candidatus Woesearchaeota archaeon]|tara:strand:+ start:36585 stop:36773 length:189 start_codon:yes stop_codon:yes gene_type:complete